MNIYFTTLGLWLQACGTLANQGISFRAFQRGIDNEEYFRIELEGKQ